MYVFFVSHTTCLQAANERSFKLLQEYLEQARMDLSFGRDVFAFSFFLRRTDDVNSDDTGTQHGRANGILRNRDWKLTPRYRICPDVNQVSPMWR
jgi:hypothetical protein